MSDQATTPIRANRRLHVFVQYASAGAAATALHYAVLFTLVNTSLLSPGPASAGGALCGAIASYLLNRQFAFAGTAAGHRQALPRFLVVALVGAGMNGVMVLVGAMALHIHYLLAQALATIVVLGTTYRFNRSWTFLEYPQRRGGNES